jgi:acetyl esterase/lipase
MKSLRTVLCLALGSVLFAATGQADEKTAKADGSFEVEVTKDVAYYDGPDADASRHKLDLYMPKGQKDFPVIVYAHGGGWAKGDRKSAEKLGKTFARFGVGFVSIGYRLSPQVKHPAHIQDVAKAFAWVHNNISKHGGKADQLYISGHSAGGHLAALLATDESYLKAEKLTLADVKGAIPISGVYRVGVRLKTVFGEDEEVVKKASPINQVNGKLPPFLLLYGDKEASGLGKQAEEFCEVLKKGKVEAASVEIKDRDHGTIVRNIPNDNDPTTQAILAFIAKHSGMTIK